MKKLILITLLVVFGSQLLFSQKKFGMKLKLKKQNDWPGGQKPVLECLFTGDYMRRQHGMNG